MRAPRRELVHVDTYRLRPDLVVPGEIAHPTPPGSVAGGARRADPAGGAALFGDDAEDV